MKYLIGLIFLFSCHRAFSYPITGNSSYIHYAFTMNINPLGNLRYGSGNFEYGYIQADNLGMMFIQRTPTPAFMQVGFGINNYGSFIVGGGLESNSSSWYRWRSDITLTMDHNVATTLVVTLGWIFIL